MSEPHRKHEPDAAVGRALMVILLAALPAVALLSLGLWLGFRAVSDPVSQSPFEPLMHQQPARDGAGGMAVLQSDPPADLEAYNRRMRGRLNSAGWFDEEAGTVHMPIDRAMDLMVERGLPEESP